MKEEMRKEKREDMKQEKGVPGFSFFLYFYIASE
jgi:hypothetical protein